jgi:eukaryotic-like serine/threonine-protein kinase
MEDVTYLAGQCPRCGKALTPDAPEGLCAVCLLTAGTGALTYSTTDDAPTVLTAFGDSGAADSDSQRLIDGQTWGPYRINRLLGRGGMGEVYEAEHTETGRRIALKVLRGRLQNADDRARFLREGQLAASISHPHTVYIFGSEEIFGMPVISMELLPGGTLKDRVAADGALPLTQAVSAVLDIIGGLDAAQQAGILHRDIKPSNCFIDSDGAVKVGDFGLSISTLARDVRHNIATDTDGFQGTPQFAPPEQLRGDPLDVRADIYAVGATLYYLLTGHPPFDARDLAELFARVTTEPPKSPRLLRPDIPPGLAAVVQSCLAKTPAERPASYAALANALRPFSSLDDSPARPGLRLVAGVVDSVIVTVILVVWRGWTLDPFTQTTGALGQWAWLLSLAYYLCFEGFWGASPGKRLFGLRVTSTDGGAPSWWSIVVRTSIFYVPNLLSTLVVLAAGNRVFITPGSVGVNRALAGIDLRETAGSIISLVLIAALFLSARRHNGWAGLHDLASGTRVVSRAAGVRRVRTSPDLAPALAGAVSIPAGLRYGPFTAVSDAGDTSDGRLLVGFDPVLRRQVWIHTLPPHTPAISAARRDVSRVGRLHWLTGGRSANQNWEAFEAPDGGPLLTREGRGASWSTVKVWLLDLATELTAAVRDGSMPALGLDRLWLRNDGHLVLLDFPAFATAWHTDAAASARQAPSAGPRHVDGPASARQAPSAAATHTDVPVSPPKSVDRADLTPVRLLSAVAAYGLSTTAHTPEQPAPLPLSARALLDNWSTASPPPLDDARKALIGVASAPDRVGRWRRAVPIALASAPILVLLTSALLLLPYLFKFANSETVEMFGWLDLLRRPDPPANSRLAEPDVRDAVERYVAGRYGAVLNDSTFWNTPVMQRGNFAELRRTAEEIMARHPSVSAEELARVSAIIAPQIQRSEQYYKLQASRAAGAGAIVITTLTALSLAFVVCCSLLSSASVPGGVVTRLLGLAVVTRDGREISRSRSLVRALLAWLPAILWLGYLLTSPKVQGWVPAPASPLVGVSLTLAALAIGATWAIARPTRGPHDWLTSTWIVPR